MALLAAGFSRFEFVPLGLCNMLAKSQLDVGNGCAYLLNCLSIGKDILESNIELAHVIFAKAIFVPTHTLEQQTRDTRDREVEGLVPFRVQCLVDHRGGLTRVP